MMMASGLSKSLGLSSSLKKQQGIETVLGGSSLNTSSAPSLRRTFSADLSSKNWLSQKGFSPMSMTSSSEKLRAFAAEDEEAEEESRSGVDIWAQIQQDKNNNNEKEKPKTGQTDVWTSILSEKKSKESSNDTVSPPYVHPLMKRASSLSEKSLKICTESLGSETGCDGISSYTSSETGGAEIESQEETNLVLNVPETTKVEEIIEADVEVEQESSITVQNHTTCIEQPLGLFPPPIRSLLIQSGSALHMNTRRDNGRLVLEAVSMPSHNNFSVKRQNGRLLLAFAEFTNEPIEIDSDIEGETDSAILRFDEEEEFEEAEEEEAAEFAYKLKLAQTPIGPLAVHRLAHKPIGVPKINSRWPDIDEFTKSDPSMPVVHSLPPRPRVAVAQLARSTKPPSTVDDTVGAACFNTCDYYWKPNNTECFDPNRKTQFQAQNFVTKSIGAGHDGWINGCKKPRRSLLSVEPFCIAT